MENLFIEIAKQVPNLGILAVIVWLFLKHLTSRDEAFNQSMRKLHEDHIHARATTDSIVRENTESNRAVIKACENLKK